MQTFLPPYSQLDFSSPDPRTPPPGYISRRPSVSTVVEAIPNIAPTENSTEDDYVYASKHVTLNLGPRIWATQLPSYGKNAIIRGRIDVRCLQKFERLELYVSGDHPQITRAG